MKPNEGSVSTIILLIFLFLLLLLRVDEFLHDGSQIEILVLFFALRDAKMLEKEMVKRVADTDEVKELIAELEKKFKTNAHVNQ